MTWYYAIFEGGRLHVNCTDDMNTTKSWSESGVIFSNRRLAEAKASFLRRKQNRYWVKGTIAVREMTIVHEEDDPFMGPVR
jgi:hypothetical protein